MKRFFPSGACVFCAKISSSSQAAIRLMDNIEKPAPAYLTKERGITIPAHPDEQRLAYNVVFGHKAPVARVFRVVAVIAHHPVVVHLKGITIGFYAVDEDVFTVHCQLVMLILGNTAFVEREGHAV